MARVLVRVRVGLRRSVLDRRRVDRVEAVVTFFRAGVIVGGILAADCALVVVVGRLCGLADRSRENEDAGVAS